MASGRKPKIFRGGGWTETRFDRCTLLILGTLAYFVLLAAIGLGPRVAVERVSTSLALEWHRPANQSDRGDDQEAGSLPGKLTPHAAKPSHGR